MQHNEILSREQFTSFRNNIRKLAASKQLTSADLICYNIIRGLPASRGFSPITNQTKLANGANPDRALTDAKYALIWKCKRQSDEIVNRYGNAFTQEVQLQLMKEAEQ